MEDYNLVDRGPSAYNLRYRERFIDADHKSSLKQQSEISQLMSKSELAQAKINAIENAFGSIILEGNSLYTLNKQQGTKTEFNQVFNSISDVFVNGDWIKDINPPKTERIIKGEDIFYTANVLPTYY